jgi:hypothetical protein
MPSSWEDRPYDRQPDEADVGALPPIEALPVEHRRDGYDDVRALTRSGFLVSGRAHEQRDIYRC